MSTFQGTGHSRSGRAFTFVGEMQRGDGGVDWQSDIFDRPGRPPLRLGGHLEEDELPNIEAARAAVVDTLRKEVVKRRA